MVPFHTFNFLGLEALEKRNRRLEWNRTSLQADMLKERAVIDGADYFDDIMVADFVLYLRGHILGRGCSWWPGTLLFADEDKVVELFARCQSKKFFDRVKVLLGVESKEELGERLRDIESHSWVPQWRWRRIVPSYYLGYHQIATKP